MNLLVCRLVTVWQHDENATIGVCESAAGTVADAGVYHQSAPSGKAVLKGSTPNNVESASTPKGISNQQRRGAPTTASQPVPLSPLRGGRRHASRSRLRGVCTLRYTTHNGAEPMAYSSPDCPTERPREMDPNIVLNSNREVCMENMLLSEAPTSSNCTSTSAAALAVMLEKEQHSYQRCPPNPNIPLAEYTQDRPLLVNWCRRLVGQGNFRSPGELVQTTMALADKYMSDQHLQTYMQDHYQLIVVTCLNIAMKTDARAAAPSYKELSEICHGAYTPEEIASEEMCILQVLAWYVHPPTASQAANHILPIVKDSTGAAWHDWELFVDRVHRLIDVSVLDLDLSMLRPSTVAVAAVLVSAMALDSQDTRQPVLRGTLSLMNMLDFDSPCEIDSIRTKLYYTRDKDCLPETTESRTSQETCPKLSDGFHQTETFRVVTPPQAPLQSTDHQELGGHNIGSTLELSTSARPLPAPRVRIKLSRLDHPWTTAEVVSSGDVADDGRVGSVPSSSSKRSSTANGGTRRTRTRVKSHSPPSRPFQERATSNTRSTRVQPPYRQGSSTAPASTASLSPLTAALARRASLAPDPSADATAKDSGERQQSCHCERTPDSITVSGAGTPEVNGFYTRHPDYLIDGCPVYGKTSYAGGGRHGAKRTMVICRATANNSRIWFIKEKGSGHYYCGREKEADVPPRVGWRVSSLLSGTLPPPKLDW
ncbi:hypothetical protein THAOC_01412 [Thalassiosira oceanica]|uniref:Cyclin-like domain-containing protein n=1 Tax=Thalassiosira oceanica TaxID=159749 RepID=K0TDN0_THAOC|nr:hypothetical protein THAOC_01412 [Thalassiosira oceanica]|eukprot:EJK76808.1 hypothetical protein THAOC_01412 [Thalassiosira oceanica]